MIRFTKYHGCGNNFIIVRESDVEGMDYSRLAADVCNVNTGIGADGFIVVRETPALEMVFYNMDGSRAPMCGNGIRCFAAYCYDYDICRKDEYPVETLAGTMIVKRISADPFMVCIEMGKPIFEPSSFGVLDGSSEFMNRKIKTSEGDFTVSSCFMGTVHTVVWVDDYPSENAASQLSNASVFSEKTNVNFVRFIDPQTLEIKTYERGVGFTCACGTGACASLVMGRKQNKTDDKVTVLLPYGRLVIEQLADGTVMMTGPAVKTAEGIYYYSKREE